MDFWTAMVVIAGMAITAGVIGSIIQSHHRAKYGITKDWLGNERVQGRAPDQPSTRERELQGEVAELRERLQVLERIATDKGANLADQIEALREVKSTSQEKKEGQAIQ